MGAARKGGAHPARIQFCIDRAELEAVLDWSLRPAHAVARLREALDAADPLTAAAATGSRLMLARMTFRLGARPTAHAAVDDVALLPSGAVPLFESTGSEIRELSASQTGYSGDTGVG